MAYPIFVYTNFVPRELKIELEVPLSASFLLYRAIQKRVVIKYGKHITALFVPDKDVAIITSTYAPGTFTIFTGKTNPYPYPWFASPTTLDYVDLNNWANSAISSSLASPALLFSNEELIKIANYETTGLQSLVNHSAKVIGSLNKYTYAVRAKIAVPYTAPSLTDSITSDMLHEAIAVLAIGSEYKNKSITIQPHHMSAVLAADYLITARSYRTGYAAIMVGTAEGIYELASTFSRVELIIKDKAISNVRRYPKPVDNDDPNQYQSVKCKTLFLMTVIAKAIRFYDTNDISSPFNFHVADARPTEDPFIPTESSIISFGDNTINVPGLGKYKYVSNLRYPPNGSKLNFALATGLIYVVTSYEYKKLTEDEIAEAGEAGPQATIYPQVGYFIFRSSILVNAEALKFVSMGEFSFAWGTRELILAITGTTEPVVTEINSNGYQQTVPSVVNRYKGKSFLVTRGQTTSTSTYTKLPGGQVDSGPYISTANSDLTRPFDIGACIAVDYNLGYVASAPPIELPHSLTYSTADTVSNGTYQSSYSTRDTFKLTSSRMFFFNEELTYTREDTYSKQNQRRGSNGVDRITYESRSTVISSPLGYNTIGQGASITPVVSHAWDGTSLILTRDVERKDIMLVADSIISTGLAISVASTGADIPTEPSTTGAATVEVRAEKSIIYNSEAPLSADYAYESGYTSSNITNGHSLVGGGYIVSKDASSFSTKVGANQSNILNRQSTERSSFFEFGGSSNTNEGLTTNGYPVVAYGSKEHAAIPTSNTLTYPITVHLIDTNFNKIGVFKARLNKIISSKLNQLITDLLRVKYNMAIIKTYNDPQYQEWLEGDQLEPFEPSIGALGYIHAIDQTSLGFIDRSKASILTLDALLLPNIIQNDFMSYDLLYNYLLSTANGIPIVGYIMYDNTKDTFSTAYKA